MSVAAMAAQHTSDIELVRAARAQDDDAFEELYRRYHRPVAGFVRRFVRDDGRAEDLAQEAFMAALKRIRQTECEIHFKPWIYEIARNAAIDHHRRSSRAKEVSFDADGGLAAADNLRLLSSAAPEAFVIDKERFDNFRGALDELSETHHRIIVMRELEGLSYREIGVRMQLSSAAVESALFRARRKLEHEYEQLDTGRRCARIRALMTRLAEGVESSGDRRRLGRHARRCWSCRRRARQLGLEPVAERSASRRAMALLPLPALLRRFGTGADAIGPGASSAREAAGMVATPAIETVAQGVHKAVVVLASAIAIGGGGATLGGVGPLAIDSGRTAAERPGGTRDSGSAAGAVGGALREKRSGTRPAGPRSGRGGGRRPSRDGRPGRARRQASRPVPSLSAPFHSSLPAGLPARPALPSPDGARVPAPSSGVKAPTLPDVLKPIAPQARQLPRLPDAPASPDVPAGVDAKGGRVGSIVPDISGTTSQLDGVPTPR